MPLGRALPRGLPNLRLCREQPLDVGAPVRARKQRVAPSTAFAVYFEEQLSSMDDSLSQQDAMCLLAER